VGQQDYLAQAPASRSQKYTLKIIINKQEFRKLCLIKLFTFYFCPSITIRLNLKYLLNMFIYLYLPEWVGGPRHLCLVRAPPDIIEVPISNIKALNGLMTGE
jgi:hypothetical protein